MKLTVRAPADGLVSAALATDGAITKGDRLVKLSLLYEESNLARVRKLMEEHLASKFQIDDPYVARQRELLASAETVARAYQTYLAKATGEAEKRLKERKIDELEVLQYKAELLEAEARTKKMASLLQSFDEMARYGKTIYEIALDVISDQIKFREKLLRNSEVTSPISGTVSMLVGEGGYLQAGQPIAEVTS